MIISLQIDLMTIISLENLGCYLAFLNFTSWSSEIREQVQSNHTQDIFMCTFELHLLLVLFSVRHATFVLIDVMISIQTVIFWTHRSTSTAVGVCTVPHSKSRFFSRVACWLAFFYNVQKTSRWHTRKYFFASTAIVHKAPYKYVCIDVASRRTLKYMTYDLVTRALAVVEQTVVQIVSFCSLACWILSLILALMLLGL